MLSRIGRAERKSAPDIIGLAEVENKRVLKDLVHTRALKTYNYGIIHYNSPDARGIDVALLYKKMVFTPTNHQSFPLEIYDHNGNKIFTRDQLLVSGFLDNQKIHFIVNHWPSRREGVSQTNYRRVEAAALNQKIITEIRQKNPFAKIISMGDFNDNATDSSFKSVLKTKGKRHKVGVLDLYNPMEAMYRKGLGTLTFDGKWDLFDQMYISGSLLHSQCEEYQYVKSAIFKPSYLLYYNGMEKGFPRRSIVKGKYIGGYSDHLPVYLLLKKRRKLTIEQ